MDSKQPMPLGIICIGADAYVCLICEQKAFGTLEDGVKHSKEPEHSEDLEAMKDCCEITAERFTCKLCRTHTPAKWDSFLLHFRSEKHFHDLRFLTRAFDQFPKSSAASNDVQEKNQEPAKLMMPTYESRIFEENCILGPMEETYFCKLCGLCCLTLPQVTKHMVGRRHRYLLKQANAKDERGRSPSNSEPSSLEIYLSSSPENEPSVTGSSGCWKILSRRKKKTTASLQSGPRGSKLFKVPMEFMPLIARHLLERQEDKIFCPACEAHITDPNKIVDHIKSQKHIAELTRYKAELAQILEDRAAALEKEKSSSSESKLAGDKKSSASVKLKNEAGTSAQQPSTSQSEVPRRRLLDIPADLTPLLESNFLIKSDYEVYCPACKVHLLHVKNIRDHINGRNHTATLKVYKREVARKKA